MTEFTASNGFSARYIDPVTDVGPALMVDGTRLVPHHVNCLREFFRHEEDERLSRWRSNVDTDIVGYAVDDASIRLVDEATHGNTSMFYRTDTDGMGPLSKAAREYFDAHPEPKPWHDATTGEFWELWLNESTVRVKAVAGTKDAMYGFHAEQGRFYQANDPTISHAIRIWPEDAS